MKKYWRLLIFDKTYMYICGNFGLSDFFEI